MPMTEACRLAPACQALANVLGINFRTSLTFNLGMHLPAPYCSARTPATITALGVTTATGLPVPAIQ